jgi:hypothetical protein
MNYMSSEAAAKATRFRTGSRRSGRFGKRSPINKQTPTTQHFIAPLNIYFDDETAGCINSTPISGGVITDPATGSFDVRRPN